jgi:A/G-specific adenine glycosylase
MEWQQAILIWYKKHKRDLPWRKTGDPYKILVAEIMLQQTQVDRVIPFYHRFIDTYPTLGDLALADKKTLLKCWSGLGYNSRALRLKKLAQEVCKQGGTIPRSIKALVALPGIGPYTANAVMAFAFNKSVPVIDTNIRRVLIHKLQLQDTISLGELQKIAKDYIPKGKSRLWHNALMDYGALVLTSKKTGIKPLSKQSPFFGSDRWIRGNIVKQLVRKNTLSISVLKKSFKAKQLVRVIEKLMKEGVIVRNDDRISLE